MLLSNEREGHMDICQVEAGGEVEELGPESDSSPLCSPLPHPRTPSVRGAFRRDGRPSEHSLERCESA